MKAAGLKTAIATFCVALWVILGAGCGKKERIGAPIPSHLQVVKLKDILKNPQAYKNREVVLEGNYGSYCCADDFSYKEGLDGVEVAPVGFETPKAEPGRPIRVYGVVRVGEERPEAEKEKEKEGEEAEDHHDVVIAAKGVEFT